MTKPIKHTTVEFDGENFIFDIVDIEGVTHNLTIHPVGMIELVREMQREKDVMLNWNNPPTLKVVRDDDQ